MADKSICYDTIFVFALCRYKLLISSLEHIQSGRLTGRLFHDLDPLYENHFLKTYRLALGTRKSQSFVFLKL